MGIFNIKKKKKTDTPEKLIPIFEKMKRNMDGRKIADEALSHRNLGNFDKALSLLKESLNKFDYIPAMTLISTTFILQKKYNEAIDWIKKCLIKLKDSNTYIKMELLANLGLIYFRELKDYDKALKVYLNALRINKPTEIDEDAYELMKSNIYRDLAGVYFMSGDIENSYKCCKLRLKVVADCELTLKLKSHIDSNSNLSKGINEPKSRTKAESKSSTHSKKDITVLLSHRLDENFVFIFEHFGYYVVWSSDFDDLKKLIIEHKINIAIEWDYGDDIIKKLIDELELNIPILLCLNLNKKIPENLSERGFVDYLDVPFQADELSFKLKKYSKNINSA